MASDRLSNLRAPISEHLSHALPSLSAPSLAVPSSRLPGPLAHHASGVSVAEIPEDIISDIVATLRNRNDGDEPTIDESLHLPLGARFKPRGHFEDDWTARPTPQCPWPVILVHGTCDTKGVWQELGTELRHDGWAVFAPDYGRRATQSIPISARQLGAYIEAVLAATGASQAVVIGHSQGGLLTRYWMRCHGGTSMIKHLVSLASPNHGTTMGGIISPFVTNSVAENFVHSLIQVWFGPVGFEQIAGSKIFDVFADDAGGELEEGVNYTCIASKQDTVIQPEETCFLNGPDSQVRNVWVQDLAPGTIIQHQDMPMDKHVRAILRAGLKRHGV